MRVAYCTGLNWTDTISYMWAGVDVLGGNQNQDKYHSGFVAPLYLVARLHLQRPSNIWPKRAAPRLPQKRSAKVVLLFAVLGARWMRRALRTPRTLATTLILVDKTKRQKYLLITKCIATEFRSLQQLGKSKCVLHPNNHILYLCFFPS